MNQATSRLCAICGMRPGTTVDHLPPKSIFPKPRPNDLITVPCCFTCNNMGSKFDEEFRVFLSLQLGMGSTVARNLWKEGALRTLGHNNRLRQHLIDKSWEVLLRGRDGNAAFKRRAVLMPVKPHNSVMNRIARGLFYHHFGFPMGRQASCHVNLLTGLSSDNAGVLKIMEERSVANGAFRYWFARASDSPLDSLWLFLFYGRHLVSVETRSR